MKYIAIAFMGTVKLYTSVFMQMARHMSSYVSLELSLEPQATVKSMEIKDKVRIGIPMLILLSLSHFPCQFLSFF